MHLLLPERQVPCQAIIFDKDGTLVELMGVLLGIGRSRAAALANKVGPMAAKAYQQAVGADLDTGWVDRDGPLSLAPRREELILTAGALYRLGHPWDDARALATAAYDEADQSLQPPYGASLLPGVATTLERLRLSGIALAIATTDRGWRARATMEALNVGHCFRAYVGADDVPNGKPAPDMVHACCQRIGCDPGSVIVVGDSPADLQMARAAGAAAAIGVLTGLNDRQRLESLADLVLPSAAELTQHLAVT
ncbi:MAG: HAD family hydrolase [Anaerolineae bacterium]